MSVEALERLTKTGWIHAKFVEFVRVVYPEIHEAIEIDTPDMVSLIFLTENTIEIARTPILSRAALEVSLETIPLSKVRGINTEFELYDVDPSDEIKLDKTKFKATVSIENREDLVIDLTTVTSNIRYKIADLTSFLAHLRRVV
ncbi:MAG TPA: hypothetical protein VE710_18330 [Candidatus Bathyarchaeia archaeon]|nr:hypothetical protein [Candidatus Bathyarchaeia archaeon]